MKDEIVNEIIRVEGGYVNDPRDSDTMCDIMSGTAFDINQ